MILEGGEGVEAAVAADHKRVGLEEDSHRMMQEGGGEGVWMERPDLLDRLLEITASIRRDCRILTGITKPFAKHSSSGSSRSSRISSISAVSLD